MTLQKRSRDLVMLENFIQLIFLLNLRTFSYIWFTKILKNRSPFWKIFDAAITTVATRWTWIKIVSYNFNNLIHCICGCITSQFRSALVSLAIFTITNFLWVTIETIVTFRLRPVFCSTLKVYKSIWICKICSIFRSSHWTCSVRKSVLRKFTKFTEKILCQILFFNKVAVHIFLSTALCNAKGSYFPRLCYIRLVSCQDVSPLIDKNWDLQVLRKDWCSLI